MHLLLEVFFVKAMEINAVNTVIMNQPAHTPCVFLRKRIMRDTHWFHAPCPVLLLGIFLSTAFEMFWGFYWVHFVTASVRILHG